MKVTIGPFKSWIGPYQIADWLQYIGYSEDECHNIGKWLAGGDDKESLLLKLCTWIDNKRKRTIKVRIDKFDTWSMDGTLSIIILPLLKQLRDTKHGSPGSMPAFSQTSEHSQYCFDFYEDGNAAAWEAGHEQWKQILDEMIWAFEQLQPDVDWEDQFWRVHPQIDLSKHPEDEGKETTPLRWTVKGDCDWEGMKRYGERIQAGLELFGKHFSDLWD